MIADTIADPQAGDTAVVSTGTDANGDPTTATM